MYWDMTNDESDYWEMVLEEKGVTEDDIWDFVTKEQISWSGALEVLLGMCTMEEAKEAWVKMNEELPEESYDSEPATVEDIKWAIEVAIEITKRREYGLELPQLPEVDKRA